jgi:hypothetical protein
LEEVSKGAGTAFSGRLPDGQLQAAVNKAAAASETTGSMFIVQPKNLLQISPKRSAKSFSGLQLLIYTSAFAKNLCSKIFLFVKNPSHSPVL